MVSSSTTISASYISKRSRSPEQQPAHKITLKVKNQQDGKEDAYRIAMNAPLKKLMNAYCQKRNLEVKAVRFVYNFKPIKPRQTPAQLSMKHEDLIDMFWEQPGGGPYSAA